jgi:hypothetical protein
MTPEETLDDEMFINSKADHAKCCLAYLPFGHSGLRHHGRIHIPAPICRRLTSSGGTMLAQVLIMIKANISLEAGCRRYSPIVVYSSDGKHLSETTGMEAKNIHRLLEVQPGSNLFTRNESNPLGCDLAIMDEASIWWM